MKRKPIILRRYDYISNLEIIDTTLYSLFMTVAIVAIYLLTIKAYDYGFLNLSISTMYFMISDLFKQKYLRVGAWAIVCILTMKATLGI